MLTSIGCLLVSVLLSGDSETIYVPDDYVTIQAAIDASNNGDLIVIYNGFYPEYNINTGGKAIAIVGSNIRNNGNDEVVIDAQGQGSVFVFDSGETTSTNLATLVITGGSATRGGGIYCNDSSPGIYDCTIRNNAASLYGGGVYLDNSSAASFYGCTIQSNTAEGMGGGIYASGDAQIAFSEVSNNGAVDKGGGIRCYNSNTLITNSLISDNGSEDGGAIATDGGTPTVTNCTIKANESAGGGGGLYCNGGIVTITNCDFQENLASINGGGVNSTGAGSIIATDCEFNLNQASNAGGGVFVGETRGPTDSSMTSCTFYLNGAMWGGGAALIGYDAAFNACTFGGTTLLGDSLGNSAQRGGALYFIGSSGDIMDTSFLYNTSTSDGGAVYLTSSSTPAISGCSFYGNDAGDDGGAVAAHSSSDATLTDCLVRYNTASNAGGGVYILEANPSMTNCNLVSNSAVIGGGVYASSPIRDGDRGLFYGVLTSCKLCANSPTHVSGPVDNGGGNVQPDLSGNGLVTTNDLVMLLDAWADRGAPAGDPDVNFDGSDNIIDLIDLLKNWGACWDE